MTRQHMIGDHQVILVTGGTGYIGSYVTKLLLERGYTVRLCVRNGNNKVKTQYLEDTAMHVDGKLEIHEADLLVPGSFNEAARGCDAVIHMASPFTLRFKDPQKDLVDPAVQGTRNVLEAASLSGTVRKIVLTSSVAAIYGDNRDMEEQGIPEFTEDHFNYSSTLSHQPYSYSKVMAEKEAWKLAKEQDRWKLVVINPAFVMGPPLSKDSDSESIAFMKYMLNGKYSLGSPVLVFGFVDVRDVAMAHVHSLEKSDAEGRYIISACSMKTLELAGLIRKKYGDRFKLPKMEVPKFLMYFSGWMYGLTFKYISRNIGYDLRFDNSKGIRELGMEYIPLETSLVDMIDQMTALKMVNH